MEVIAQHKDWLRLIKQNGFYVVQMRVRHFLFWHTWQTVTFGPYGPYPVGMSKFKLLHLLMEDYNECVKMGKEYTRRGITC